MRLFTEIYDQQQYKHSLNHSSIALILLACFLDEYSNYVLSKVDPNYFFWICQAVSPSDQFALNLSIINLVVCTELCVFGVSVLELDKGIADIARHGEAYVAFIVDSVVVPS